MASSQKFGENIGPCALIYDSVSLGDSFGGVEFSAEDSAVETYKDKTGDTPDEIIMTGTKVMVTGAITKPSLDQLAKILGGTVTEGSTKDELVISSRVGTNLADSAAILILKPIIAGVVTTDASKWITIPKATCLAKFSVMNDLKTQKVWAFEFSGLPLTADDVASGATWGGGDWAENNLYKLGEAD